MNDEQKRWYREEFEKISKLISDTKSLSHYQFLRIRNYKLQVLSKEKESEIKKITKNAFSLAKKDKIKEAIKVLTDSKNGLDGVRIPIASAILAMKYPKKYAIVDKRVIDNLRKYKKKDFKSALKTAEGYEKYLRFMRAKAGKKELREYERKLFEMEKKK